MFRTFRRVPKTISSAFFKKPISKARFKSDWVGAKPITSKEFARELCVKGGIAATLSLYAGTLYFLYLYGFHSREIPVLGDYIDIKKNSHGGLIVASERFEYAGPKQKGELSGQIVKNMDSGRLYLQKGAGSKDALVRECFISLIYAMLRPGEQPRSFILEEKQDQETVRFYTLTEMLPNTMDLEDFFKNINWAKELATTPLEGLEEALAADLGTGKKRDLKLANLLITKVKTNKGFKYVVTSIDHEFAGVGLLAKSLFMTDTDNMLQYIKDFQPFHEDFNGIPHAGSSEALKFMNCLAPLLKKEKVLAFYEKVVNLDQNKIEQIFQAINGDNGVATREECDRLREMLSVFQAGAYEQLSINKSLSDTPQLRR